MKKSIEISPNIETLFGTRDENLHVLEDGLNVAIDLRSDSIELDGAPRDVARAEQVFADYEQLQRSGHVFTNGYFTDEAANVIFSKTNPLSHVSSASQRNQRTCPGLTPSDFCFSTV